MNKRDFWILVVCNITVLALLIEHLCGLDLALWCMCICGVISAIIHIYILRDYVKIYIVEEE
jgi:hypothetical protein